MKQVYIYKPAKNAMQSGFARCKTWVMEFRNHQAHYVEPLMGWTGSRDTTAQIHLFFSTKQEALDYALKHHLEAIIKEPAALFVHPKSYADNFTQNHPQ